MTAAGVAECDVTIKRVSLTPDVTVGPIVKDGSGILIHPESSNLDMLHEKTDPHGGSLANEDMDNELIDDASSAGKIKIKR